jgi:hypothetical protein
VDCFAKFGNEFCESQACPQCGDDCSIFNYLAWEKDFCDSNKCKEDFDEEYCNEKFDCNYGISEDPDVFEREEIDAMAFCQSPECIE